MILKYLKNLLIIVSTLGLISGGLGGSMWVGHHFWGDEGIGLGALGFLITSMILGGAWALTIMEDMPSLYSCSVSNVSADRGGRVMIENQIPMHRWKYEEFKKVFELLIPHIETYNKYQYIQRLEQYWKEYVDAEYSDRADLHRLIHEASDEKIALAKLFFGGDE